MAAEEVKDGVYVDDSRGYIVTNGSTLSWPRTSASRIEVSHTGASMSRFRVTAEEAEEAIQAAFLPRKKEHHNYSSSWVDDLEYYSLPQTNQRLKAAEKRIGEVHRLASDNHPVLRDMQVTLKKLEGLKIKEFQTNDVYEVHKLIDRLNQRINLVRSEIDQRPKYMDLIIRWLLPLLVLYNVLERFL